MTGLGSATGGMNQMPQMSPTHNPFAMGMPGMFPMMPAYSAAGSVYGGSVDPQAQPVPARAAASVYGEPHGPRPTASSTQPRPNRSRSSPSLDRLVAEQSSGPSRPTRQAQPYAQRPLPAPNPRRPIPQSMVPTKGPDNEPFRSATSTYGSSSTSGVPVPPSSWRTRSSGDRIR